MTYVETTRDFPVGDLVLPKGTRGYDAGRRMYMDPYGIPGWEPTHALILDKNPNSLPEGFVEVTLTEEEATALVARIRSNFREFSVPGAKMGFKSEF